MANDCLAGYIYAAKQSGEIVNRPSDLKAIDPNSEYEDYKEVFVNLVAVDVDEYAKKHFEKAVKKTVLFLNGLMIWQFMKK